MSTSYTFNGLEQKASNLEIAPKNFSKTPILSDETVYLSSLLKDFPRKLKEMTS